MYKTVDKKAQLVITKDDPKIELVLDILKTIDTFNSFSFHDKEEAIQKTTFNYLANLNKGRSFTGVYYQFRAYIKKIALSTKISMMRGPKKTNAMYDNSDYCSNFVTDSNVIYKKHKDIYVSDLPADIIDKAENSMEEKIDEVTYATEVAEENDDFVDSKFKWILRDLIEREQYDTLHYVVNLYNKMPGGYIPSTCIKIKKVNPDKINKWMNIVEIDGVKYDKRITNDIYNIQNGDKITWKDFLLLCAKYSCEELRYIIGIKTSRIYQLTREMRKIAGE